MEQVRSTGDISSHYVMFSSSKNLDLIFRIWFTTLSEINIIEYKSMPLSQMEVLLFVKNITETLRYTHFYVQTCNNFMSDKLCYAAYQILPYIFW